jgi:hypothetical protein
MLADHEVISLMTVDNTAIFLSQLIMRLYLSCQLITLRVFMSADHEVISLMTADNTPNFYVS